MDILIIGGSRFVGPILVDKLLGRGHNVTVFNRGQIKSEYTGVNFIQGDRNKEFNLDQKFDVVIDMCAYTGDQTRAAIDQLKFDFFLNFGTGAAYKKPDNLPLTENSPLGDWPIWGDYNKGQVEGELVLEESGIKFATLRPVYIFGPENYCDRENFIYSRISNGVPLVLPGDGEARNQFVFAKDVAESFVLLAEQKLAGAFNCASDDIITLNGLVREMGKIVGKEPILKFNPDADGVNWKESEFPFANETFFCTNDKLKSLGIKFTPLIDGLKEDYKNYYSKHLI